MIVNNTSGINLDAVLTRLLPAGIVPNTNAATGIAVLVGTAEWGPMNLATALGSFSAFVTQFGSYQEDGSNRTDAYEQARGYFDGGQKRRIAGGGNDLRMIRIGDGTEAKAAGTIVDTDSPTPGTVGTDEALYEGDAGNRIRRTIADGDLRLSAPAAPTGTPQTTGGTLASGTVGVTLTEVNNKGETIASAVASFTVVGPTGSIDIDLPTPSASGVGFNVYAGSGAGTRYRATANPVTGATYTLTALPANTNPTAPTTNTAVASFHYTVFPFDDRPAEVFRNLTPETAAQAVNVGTPVRPASQMVRWTAGASTLMPATMDAYLTGGDSGLPAVDADYVGTAGILPTGLELARTISEANFVIAGKQSAAIKAQLQSVCTDLYAQTVIGPDDSTVTPDDAMAEQTFDDWGVVYAYSYQNWLNPVTGNIQAVLPVGSIVGALCNGPFWVNLTQCKLLGYLGPTNPLSEVDANRLAGRGIIPITAGSVCRKGSNTSSDASINQIEDQRIPVKLAKDADATVQPLLGEPQVVNPANGQSDFFDDLREALENLIRSYPREAIERAYVDAQYDPNLASQNKAKAAIVARQTGKANQIFLDITEGRTALSVVPNGVNIISGS